MIIMLNKNSKKKCEKGGMKGVVCMTRQENVKVKKYFLMAWLPPGNYSSVSF